MSNLRIKKKVHSRFLADFCVEASQDEKWLAALAKLSVNDVVSTEQQGWPEDFSEIYAEVNIEKLSYQAARVTLDDVPRQASCWWPTDEKAHYFKFAPVEFPNSSIFMMIDCFDEQNCAH